jgi:hypothetical protein
METTKKLKVAVCFYGLCRSTHFTIKSIRKNIYNALDNLDINYDVYLHTYKIDKEYNNSWSGETKQKINNDNWKLLNPIKFLIENEDDVIKQLDLPKYRTHGDPWSFIGDNTFNTLNNAILTLYSTYQVTQLWKNSKIKYDIIISLRPDMLFVNPILINYLNQINNNIIILTDFAEHPINDRFAMGNSTVMQIHGERFLGAYNYSLSHPLHAETYLNYILENNAINIKKINFVFLRLRLNGTSPDLQDLQDLYYDNNNNKKIAILVVLLISLFIAYILYKIYCTMK